MKHLSRVLSLLLAGVMLFTAAACGKAEPTVPAADPAHTQTNPAPTTPTTPQPTQPAEPAPAPAQPTVQEEIRPGMLPRPERGAYYSGTTVAFENEAYTAFSDGIYRLENGEPLLLTSDYLHQDTSICTDGYLLYYITTSGVLWELDMESGEVTPITERDALDLPSDANVVGATQGNIWVEIPFQDSDSYDVSDGQSILAIGRISGAVNQEFPFSTAGCAGGYVWIQEFTFDYGPRGLQIFSPEDECIVQRDDVWSVSGEVGAIWYDSYDEDRDYGVLYHLDSEGESEAFTVAMEMDESYYGMSLCGYLITQTAVTGSGDFRTYYWDVRTGEAVPASHTWIGLYEPYWDEGCTVSGQDFLLCYDRVARITDDGPVDVVELPTDIQGGRIVLWDEWLALDCWEGEYYVLPFAPDAETILTPMTKNSLWDELYDGKNGATVLGEYTEFGAGNNVYWPMLNESLSVYNGDASQRLHVNLENLVNTASQQIEDGFATSGDMFFSSVRAYVRRSDTNAFCFVEHQSEDNRVNALSLDIKTGYNFDTKDGHELGLDEVVTDLSALKEMLADRLQDERYPTRAMVEAFLDDLFDRESYCSSPDFSWVLGYEGITFYFNGQINYPYEITGISRTIPFAAAPGLFEEKWLSVPRNYAYDILLDDMVAEDYVLTEDSGFRTVDLSLSRDYTTGMITGINLYQGSGILGEKSQTVSRPLSCDDAYGSILHQDGKNYLAVQCAGDDLWLQFYALDDSFSRIFTLDEGALPQNLAPYDFDSDLPYYANCWLGDPDFFAVNGKEWSNEDLAYTHRVYYRFTPQGLTRLDLSGASLAYG